MKYNQAADTLSKALAPKRFTHSLGVSKAAAELAKTFGEDIEKSKMAGLLHDCARGISSNNLLQMAEGFGIVVDDVELSQPILVHAPLGAYLAKADYGIDDPEILKAITLHTTGAANMSKLEKIIYLADCIEPSRDYPGVDKLRMLATRDLDAAVLAAFDQSLQFVIERGLLIHPATVEGRNYLLQRQNI